MNSGRKKLVDEYGQFTRSFMRILSEDIEASAAKEAVALPN
ncbi:hypothetical protein ACCUM_0583 [Candidatus Accumulibacter phosphatis]|uniref:Uncharacterized protein n=1 Tax=Candidatus Accumulibacter phosphatis TaxID=327160 RepID=A0A5S4EK73_9PROT|nr:hypothetical protein ACCUM_0583 [Candidatus Accumulibacter phosphatis]